MIRLICCEVDGSIAAHVGGPVRVIYKTFDVDLEEVEAWLLAEKSPWLQRSFVGMMALLERKETGSAG